MVSVPLEDIDEEWKEIWRSEYLRTISAFYNTAGGRFIVGRRDDGTFVGVQDVKGTLKSVSDSIQNVLGISATVRSQSFSSVMCIIVDVPVGRNKINYDGRFYKRVGNTTRLIRREELKDIISEERGTFWMDEPCDFTPADIVQTAISSLVVKGQGIGRIPKDVDPEGRDCILSRYGLVRDGRLTIAGALLFTAEPTRINRGAFLKIGLFDRDEVLKREDIIETPLMLLPDEAMNSLLEKYIPPTFSYGSASRTLSSRYPVEGLREIVVNAIVHKDYRIEEPVTVSVHPNRIDVFCYGGLPEGWTTETLIGDHQSLRRNITLATLYHDAGFVENWAQGIRKVFRECERNGNPKPEFSLESGGLRVTVTSNVIDVDERIPISVVSTKTKSPTDRQKVIVRMMAANPGITISSIASELGVSPRTVKNDINALTEMGFIRREGNNRSGEWVVMIRILEG